MDEKINLNDYICYNRPLPENPRIKNMTKEEFIKLFGEYL